MPTGIYKRIKKRGGWKLSEETKRKISLSNKGKFLGRKLSDETKEKLRQINLGKKHSQEWKDNMSKTMKGNKYSLGYKHPEEFGIKLSERNKKFGIMPPHYSGQNHYNWQGGKSFEPYSVDWTKTLRRSIRERDRYICQICNDYGKHIHHIDYDKQNCNPNNLITLCVKCHRKTNDNRDYWMSYFKNGEAVGKVLKECLDKL